MQKLHHHWWTLLICTLHSCVGSEYMMNKHVPS